jgi:phosphatidylglycerol---prolipoprotein diacylglyceryl transferase
MDPIMLQLGPLAIRWYGFLIASGVFLGTLWAVRAARRRGLDENKLLDMAVWIVIAALIGARLVYVLTSPSAFFGPGGNPWNAFKLWEGGISIHGGVLGVVLATWLYCRRHKLNMWAYLDVMTPVGALGIIGGRIGNFMNGTDTAGRLTDLPFGFTWPQPGTATWGALGKVIFGQELWSAYPGVCSLGSFVNLSDCVARGGEIVRGPVHLTQIYGMMVGVILIPILVWVLRKRTAPGVVFWQFVLWYSVLRSVIEEPFRDNPLFPQAFLAEGPNLPGIGLFTLTQLISVPLVLVAVYFLLTAEPIQTTTLQNKRGEV